MVYATKIPEVPRSGGTKCCPWNDFVNVFFFFFCSHSAVPVLLFFFTRRKEKRWFEKTELPEAKTGTIFVAPPAFTGEENIYTHIIAVRPPFLRPSKSSCA